MKRVVFWMMAALLIATAAVSCKMTLPGRFESFVEKVEKNQADFTEDDWIKADEQYAQLEEEYEQIKESLNAKQKRIIDGAIGKYLPNRFESLVAQVEKEGKNFSDDEWTNADAKFKQLNEEYKQKKSSLKPDEKKRITHSIGKFLGLRLKKKLLPIDNLFDTAKEAGEGMVGGVTGSDDASQKLSDLIDEAKKKGVEYLGECIEDLTGLDLTEETEENEK